MKHIDSWDIPKAYIISFDNNFQYKSQIEKKSLNNIMNNNNISINYHVNNNNDKVNLIKERYHSHSPYPKIQNHNIYHNNHYIVKSNQYQHQHNQNHSNHHNHSNHYNQYHHNQQNQVVKKIHHYSYGLNHKIGKGFSSIVYKGKNDITQQTVAIKVIQLNTLKDNITKNMLHTQIQTLKKLAAINSPYILKYLDSYITSNNCYIITQYCNQGDLYQYLKNKKNLTQNQLIPIFYQIYTAYKSLSTIGLIHRDLKLANIFVDNNNNFKLADFGFAKSSSQNPKDNYNVGTPIYMAPQTMFSNIYTQKSDIWSLGVICYELLHGKAPWKGLSQKQIRSQIQNPKIQFNDKFFPSISNELKDFIKKCLKSNPYDRMNLYEMSKHQWIKKILSMCFDIQNQDLMKHKSKQRDQNLVLKNKNNFEIQLKNNKNNEDIWFQKQNKSLTLNKSQNKQMIDKVNKKLSNINMNVNMNINMNINYQNKQNFKNYQNYQRKIQQKLLTPQYFWDQLKMRSKSSTKFMKSTPYFQVKFNHIDNTHKQHQNKQISQKHNNHLNLQKTLNVKQNQKPILKMFHKIQDKHSHNILINQNHNIINNSSLVQNLLKAQKDKNIHENSSNIIAKNQNKNPNISYVQDNSKKDQSSKKKSQQFHDEKENNISLHNNAFKKSSKTILDGLITILNYSRFLYKMHQLIQNENLSVILNASMEKMLYLIKNQLLLNINQHQLLIQNEINIFSIQTSQKKWKKFIKNHKFIVFKTVIEQYIQKYSKIQSSIYDQKIQQTRQYSNSLQKGNSLNSINSINLPALSIKRTSKIDDLKHQIVQIIRKIFSQLNNEYQFDNYRFKKLQILDNLIVFYQIIILSKHGWNQFIQESNINKLIEAKYLVDQWNYERVLAQAIQKINDLEIDV